MTAQTTEHYGMIAILTLILTICRTQNLCKEELKNQKIQIWVDNSEVVRRCQLDKDELIAISQYVCADYELWRIIQQLIKEIPMKIKVNWVKSHQDKKQHPQELPQNAQLNILVDKQADQHRMRGEQPEPQPYWMPEKIRWNDKEGKAIPDISEYVQQQTVGINMEKYLISKYPTWTKETIDTINWEAVKKNAKKKETYPAHECDTSTERLAECRSTKGTI